MSIQISRVSTFLAGSVSVLFSMGLATAQPSANVVRLSEEMDQLVRDSLTAYNETVERIASEKTPLIKEVGELERGNIALRSELNRYQRIVDEGQAAVEKMNVELLELESQTQYIERMLEEYLSKFESRIHLAEDQQFKPALSEIRISLTDRPGDTAGRFERYGEVLNLGIDRQDESFGGYAFNGRAIDSEGVVRSGKVAVVGPSAYFVSDDASTGGFLRFHSGTIEPGLAELSGDQLPGLADFVSGREGTVPFDASLGDALALDASNLTLMEQVQQGGVVGYFIIALGVVAALLSVVKLTDLSRFSASFPGNLGEIAAKARDKSVDEAMAASGAQGVVREMLEMGARNINANTVLLEEMMLSIILKRRPEMERFLPFLAITAAASPLLGLLGTVVGMIKTFALITVFGTGDPQALSSGISEALVTTELGLVVAIPTLVLHGLFTRMVRSRVSVMEQIAFEFAKIASSKESQPAS